MFVALRMVNVLAVAVCLTACQPGSRNALVLPEGDAEQGRAVFVELQCTGCHSVVDVDLPEPAAPREITHLLGGQRVKTYPELVTSIINPSHRIAGRFRRDEAAAGGDSPMIVYNDVLTVTQLVDLVAFLQPQYRIDRPVRYRYVPYTYPE